MSKEKRQRELYGKAGNVKLQSRQIKLINGIPHILIRRPYDNPCWERLRISDGSVVETM